MYEDTQAYIFCFPRLIEQWFGLAYYVVYLRVGLALGGECSCQNMYGILY